MLTKVRVVQTDMFVHVVGGDQHVRVFAQHLAQRRSSSPVYTAPVGLDGLLMTTSLVLGVIAASSCAGGDLEALLDAGLDDHRLAVGEHHDVGVGHPVRRRDDDLVAGD